MEEERRNDQQTADEAEFSSSKPAPWLIIGFIAVAALVIAGLFLPPISLGQRLAGRGGDTVEETAVETVTNNETTAVTDSSDLSDTEIAAVPADIIPVGEVVVTADDEMGNVDTVRISYPAGTDISSVDLYGWNGDEWVFVPSLIEQDSQEVVSLEQPLYAAYALGEPEPVETLMVAAEWGAGESPAPELVAALNQVIAGPLKLDGSGGLQGEVSGIPSGEYGRFLRVTNVGAVVDEASLSSFLSDTDAQAIQIETLVNTASSGNFDGVNVDYQGVSAAQEAAFTDFLTTLAAALEAEGLELGVTLGTPQFSSSGWEASGQDWAAVGQLADVVYVKMPLDPTSYVANGPTENMLRWATRQVDRRKLVALIDGRAVDRLGESFIPLSNDAALENFGEMQFVQGGEELEPDEPIEVVLSGNATPLEWDGASLTYKYSYEDSGQNHSVWLANPAALAQRLALAANSGLRGVAVRGLGDVTDGAGYAAALQSVMGAGEPPEPTGVAIVWTLLDEDGSVLASESGSEPAFSWDGGSEGSYTLNVDFALGDVVATLDSTDIVIVAAEEELVTVSQADEEEEEEAQESDEEAPDSTPDSTPAPPATFDPGANDAVVNTNANVRIGPGLSFGTVAGGANAGTAVNLIGRTADNSWYQVVLPDGQEGWIFATLLTVNSSFDVGALEIVEVESPVAGGGGGGAAPPPPAPVSGAFELGGQTAGMPIGAMNSAGMTWIKRQHKWSPGNRGTDVQGLISEGHNAGFKVLLSIPGQLNPSSIDFESYVNFLGEVAALPDPPDAIEVWNEMNITREWPAGEISPSSYVNNMLKPAYTKIKAANPNVMVITGAPAPTGFYGGSCGGGGCDDAPYIAGMMAAGAGSFSDCIGVHYNEGIMPPAATSGDPRGSSGHYTRYYQGMVNAYTAAGAGQLCFTELGYLSGEEWGFVPGGFLWKAPYNLTVAEQARYLAEAVSLAANSGRVRLLIIFNVDFTTWGDDPQAGYAMIRPGGGCPACETVGAVMRGR